MRVRAHAQEQQRRDEPPAVHAVEHVKEHVQAHVPHAAGAEPVTQAHMEQCKEQRQSDLPGLSSPLCIPSARVPLGDTALCAPLLKVPEGASVTVVGFGRTLAACALWLAMHHHAITVYDPSNVSAALLHATLDAVPGAYPLDGPCRRRHAL